MGIEPTLAAWEAAVLPLNYTRGEAHSSVEPRLGKGAPLAACCCGKITLLRPDPHAPLHQRRDRGVAYRVHRPATGGASQAHGGTHRPRGERRDRAAQHVSGTPPERWRQGGSDTR